MPLPIFIISQYCSSTAKSIFHKNIENTQSIIYYRTYLDAHYDDHHQQLGSLHQLIFYRLIDGYLQNVFCTFNCNVNINGIGKICCSVVAIHDAGCVPCIVIDELPKFQEIIYQRYQEWISHIGCDRDPS